MAWHDIPGVNCLFALDYNSPIESSGSILKFSNLSEIYLKSENSIKNKIEKKKSSGYSYKNYKIDYRLFKTYKVLSINKQNYLFSSRLHLKDQKAFTLILKAKIYSKTGFLLSNVSSSTSISFLEYSEGSEDYRDIWRLPGVKTASKLASQIPGDFKNRDSVFIRSFDTVVLRVDGDLKKGSLKTSSGTYTLSEEYFLNEGVSWLNGYFDRIGATSSGWEPHTDIVYFGLFDGILDEDQEVSLIAEAESEFLVSESLGDYFENRDYFLKSSSDSLSPKFYKIPDTKEGYTFNFTSKEPKNFKILLDQRSDLFDLEDIVTKEMLPISSKLFLYNKRSGVLLDSSVSDEKGRFKFYNLNPDFEYQVTSYDPKLEFNSIIKDY